MYLRVLRLEIYVKKMVDYKKLFHYFFSERGWESGLYIYLASYLAIIAVAARSTKDECDDDECRDQEPSGGSGSLPQ